MQKLYFRVLEIKAYLIDQCLRHSHVVDSIANAGLKLDWPEVAVGS
jgi:hypothetical protein